jgi:hypothetical protein
VADIGHGNWKSKPASSNEKKFELAKKPEFV